MAVPVRIVPEMPEQRLLTYRPSMNPESPRFEALRRASGLSPPGPPSETPVAASKTAPWQPQRRASLVSATTHPAWVQVASNAVSDDPRLTMKTSREMPRLSITDQALVTPSGMAERGPSSPTAPVALAADGSGASAEALGEGRVAGASAGTIAPRRHTSALPRRTPRHS